MNQKITIMGFGNPARNDDGVGPYVAQQLALLDFASEEVEVLDMGTSAFEVLFKLKGSREIILIDAVLNSGKPDGSLFKLPAEEIQAQIQNDPLVFLHSLKWSQALHYAREMLGDQYPKDNITVYLIAVEDIGFGVDLSEPVKRAGDRLISKLKETYFLSHV